MAFSIRMYGDPVLKSEAAAVTEVDGKLVRLADEMVHVMYAAPGIGLAAPQIGVQKQMFVYDIGEGPATIVNPRDRGVVGGVGVRGRLSVDPGSLRRDGAPKEVLLSGSDLDGNEISIEADEMLGRLFQHELDHLHGVLMFDRMTPEQRKAALTEYRRLQETPEEQASPPRRRRLRLP